MLPAHKKIQQPNAPQKKVMVSFVVRDEQEPKHRAGVNSLQYDPNMERLFSAGRDSIIRTWDCKNLNKPYIQSLEHHTDWVNDIVLCCGGKNLISASSDTTVKVWNAYKGFCMSTLRTHKDYVRALAYAKDQERVASAGLDKAIFLWDINTLTALTASNNTVTTSSVVGSKNSIYSLAMNPSGTIIVGGSTEKVLRVWDPRTCDKLMKLVGHKDNVKALLVNRDGTQCLSGSSDGTVKLWSLGQQQCILTIRASKEGIWAIAANEDFSYVICSGRDRQICKIDLKSTNPSTTLITKERNPVLKIYPYPDFSGIWVATDESSINFYSLKEKAESEDMDGDYDEVVPPKATIEGAPAIRKYRVLNDKRHILTQDSEGNVSLYDVLQIKKVEDYGKVDFDEKVKEKFKMMYVPNWFSVDLKTGFLTIHLGQEENDCFCAWVAGKDVVGLTIPPDQKVNYGFMLLKALLEHWKYTIKDDEKEEIEKEQNTSSAASCLGSETLPIPQHTPLIFTEVGNRTLYRVTVQDCGGQTETHILNETVPDWVRERLIVRKVPKFVKISFYLLPPNEFLNKNTKRDRLVANDFIQVQKIIEHVYEKLCGSDCSSTACSTTTSNIERTNPSLAENQTSLLDSIEIICNDKVLDPSMELRTVKHHIWKSSSDLTLYYKANKCNMNYLQKS